MRLAIQPRKDWRVHIHQGRLAYDVKLARYMSQNRLGPGSLSPLFRSIWKKQGKDRGQGYEMEKNGALFPPNKAGPVTSKKPG